LAKSRGKHPVLFIDEANLVRSLDEQVQQGGATSSRLLDQIVKSTKQSRELEVIMASAKHNYPDVLERNGLNRNDIKFILFAGEISPKSMWELLVTNKKNKAPMIGMGENLAHLLIASYGGHLFRLSNSLHQLMREKNSLRFTWLLIRKDSIKFLKCIHARV
jgi:hypothetical protein